MTSWAPEDVLASGVSATLDGLRTDLVGFGPLPAGGDRALLAELVRLVDDVLDVLAGADPDGPALDATGGAA